MLNLVMAQIVLVVSEAGQEVIGMRENREKWMELCAKAADEQDPHKLAVLILQINALLEAQERRLIEKAGSIRQNGVMREVDRRYGMNES